LGLGDNVGHRRGESVPSKEGGTVVYCARGGKRKHATQGGVREVSGRKRRELSSSDGGGKATSVRQKRKFRGRGKSPEKQKGPKTTK